ncbi:MAG: hypothetical protein AB8B63_01920 [Granulosicoccus sp.]
MRSLSRPLCLLLLCIVCDAVHAEVHGNGVGQLLLSDLFAPSGFIALLTTLLLLAYLPAKRASSVYLPVALMPVKSVQWVRTATSLTSMCFFFVLIIIGVAGSRDPLANPLPMYLWTVWWVIIVALHGLFGNLWYYLNPWSGLVTVSKLILPETAVTDRTSEASAELKRVGVLPAIIVFVLFALFYFVYPAPSDPFRLALIVSTYWVVTFIAMCWYGEQAWANRGEFITIISRAYARLAPVGLIQKRPTVAVLHIGFPGWQFVYESQNRPIRYSTAVFFLLLSGVATFAIFSDTQLWYQVIGVDPLSPIGRSAVLWHNTIGLIVVNVALIALFSLSVLLGSALAQNRANPVSRRLAFGMLAGAVLPLALACHVSRYLSEFTAGSVQRITASTDPYLHQSGIPPLGNPLVVVETLLSNLPVGMLCFFQMGLLVAGHTVAISLAYSGAIRIYGNAGRAIRCILPVACFLLAHTCLGLLLLALPRVV